MPLRVPVATLLSALVLAGCGGEDEERSRVRDYMDRANAILRQQAGEFKRANEAYAAFADGEAAPAVAAAELGRAERDIRAARARLADLRPPKDARRLHSKLVRLFGLNLAFARETTLLAGYQEGAGAALTRLDRYEDRLRDELEGADDPGAQADAMRRFAERLALTRRRLRALDAPRVLVVRHRRQLLGLDSTRELAADLRSALEAGDGQRVARLLDDFREHERANLPSGAVDRRTIARYERSYRRLNQARAELSREQARLERTLD